MHLQQENTYAMLEVMQEHAESLRHMAQAIYYHEKAVGKEREAQSRLRLGRYDGLEEIMQQALSFFSLYRDNAVQHNLLMQRNVPTELQLEQVGLGEWTQYEIQEDITRRTLAFGGYLDVSFENERRIANFLEAVRTKRNVALVRSMLDRNGVHFEATCGIFTACTHSAAP